MIIKKASRTGNCKSLNSNGLSVGVIGMRDNSTCSLLNFPFNNFDFDYVFKQFNNLHN
jgi:hypothetical protein